MENINKDMIYGAAELTEEELNDIAGGGLVYDLLFNYGHYKGLNDASSGKCSKASGILSLTRGYKDGYKNGQKMGGC